MSEFEVFFEQGLISYLDACELQTNLTRRGNKGFYLFSCFPVITVGRQAEKKDILLTEAELKSRSIECLKVNRGGKVTYHGPEQLLGFPLGNLFDHVGDSRGVQKFTRKIEENLMDLLQKKLPTCFEVFSKCGGIWIKDSTEKPDLPKKIVSTGYRFSRQQIHHGFSLNLLPMPQISKWIHPCGIPNTVMASVFESKPSKNEKASFIDALIRALKQN